MAIVADFVDKSLSIEDPEALFGCYLDALREYGVDRVLYSALRNTPHEEVAVPGISHCYPEDWIAYYMEKNIMDIGLLAKYMGVWRWTVKKHMKPKHFNKLTDEQLAQYAEIFNISVKQLTDNNAITK